MTGVDSQSHIEHIGVRVDFDTRDSATRRVHVGDCGTKCIIQRPCLADVLIGVVVHHAILAKDRQWREVDDLKARSAHLIAELIRSGYNGAGLPN
jgi:hypothetical protein